MMRQGVVRLVLGLCLLVFLSPMHYEVIAIEGLSVDDRAPREIPATPRAHPLDDVTTHRPDMVLPSEMSVGARPARTIKRPRDADPAVSHTFGSDAILHACWSEKALAGLPEDRLIHHGMRPLATVPRADYMEAAVRQLPPLAPEYRGSIRYVDPSEQSARLVALTFDLCEGAKEATGYDAGIVNYLRQHRIKATFFAGGKWMATHPDKAKQLMADPLFEIGNHTWTHRNLRLLAGEKAREQVLWTQAEYAKLRDELAQAQCAASAGPTAMDEIPPVPRLFRFPYGVCSPGVLATVADAGLAAIQWSVVTGDPALHQTPRGIADAVLRGVKSHRGSIVVAHANGRGWHTAEALPLFIPELARRGYRFVTVSELLSSGKPVAVGECYELRPGDNARYDALPGRSVGK
jgi:peptidoglycan-N-acetylglucosamine deacetylase